MKNSTLQLVAMLIIVLAFQASWAQSPQKMSYQAVIRNSSDKLVVNQKIGMQISILKGSESGTVVYTETQKPTTNINGLVTLEIGGGTTINDFSAIDWTNGQYYIKTETDPSGGTSYTIIGTSRLLSVPYALYAKNVENDKVEDADADPTNEIQMLSKSGDMVSLSKGGGSVSINDADADPTNEIQVLSKTGNTVSLSRNGGNFIDEVDDADADPTNEIQVLSINGNNLTLSRNGGTVPLPSSGGGDGWGSQTVSTDATLSGLGTTASTLKIADNGVTSAKILDGTIASTDLADNSVTSAKIANATIIAADLANNAVTTDKIEIGAVTGAKIAQAGATTGQALKWNGSSWLPGTDIASGGVAGGDLGGTYPNPAVTKIQGISVSNIAPTTGQVLSFSGVSWKPATTSGGFTLPFSDSASYSEAPFSINNNGSSLYTIEGFSTNGYGIYGKTKSNNSAGVLGMGTGSNFSQGVCGMTGEQYFSGVLSNTNYGVVGISGANTSVAGFSVSGTGGLFQSRSGLALQTMGKLQLTGIGEATGRVLTCDSTGLATWQNVAGGVGELTLPFTQTVSNATPAFEVINSSNTAIKGFASAATGAVSGVYGESSSINGYGLFGKSPKCGIRGEATSTTEYTSGVVGWTNSVLGIGVYGSNFAETGTTYGVKGIASSVSGTGVYGQSQFTGVYGGATASSGWAYGVYGASVSPDFGHGVIGTSPHIGVRGIGSGSTDISYGIYGETPSSSGYGIYGTATATSGLTYGVYGETQSTSGCGVYGYNTAISGTTAGVYGKSISPFGIGVYGTSPSRGLSGVATATSGNSYGVIGYSYSSETGASGVAGQSTASTGETWGLRGNSSSSEGGGVYGYGKQYGIYGISPSGYAGYFAGKLYVSENVGIGTVPYYSLDVAGAVNISAGVPEGAGLRCNGAEALWFNGTYFSWGFGADYNLFWHPVSIGRFPVDGYDLTLNGNAIKAGSTTWDTWSDIRLKDIHGTYEKGLKEITALQPVNFTYKKENACKLPSDKNYVGFVAQEVQKVFPEAVSEGKDSYLTLDINSINVAMVNAIKELKIENDKLKSECENFKAESNKLKIESDQLKTENELLKLKNEQIDSRLINIEKIIGVSAMK